MNFSAIYRGIRAHQGNDPHPRLMKLSEEVGEVNSAYIGVRGLNKRKGVTHTDKDVASELCDVVITAMVALHDWTDNPAEFLENHVNKIIRRVEKDGS